MNRGVPNGAPFFVHFFLSFIDNEPGRSVNTNPFDRVEPYILYIRNSKMVIQIAIKRNIASTIYHHRIGSNNRVVPHLRTQRATRNSSYFTDLTNASISIGSSDSTCPDLFLGFRANFRIFFAAKPSL